MPTGTYGGSISGPNTLSLIQQALDPAFRNRVSGVIVPNGNYDGQVDTGFLTTLNYLISNPWGVPAIGRFGYAPNDPRRNRITSTINLAPGQSYNVITGQFSNPALAGNTVKNLNQATALRRVNESELNVGNNREYKTALATLDEQYVYNATSLPTTAQALSSQAVVNAQGTNIEGNARTLLGRK